LPKQNNRITRKRLRPLIISNKAEAARHLLVGGFIYGMSSFPTDELIFFKMVIAPPTRLPLIFYGGIMRI